MNIAITVTASGPYDRLLLYILEIARTIYISTIESRFHFPVIWPHFPVNMSRPRNVASFGVSRCLFPRTFFPRFIKIPKNSIIQKEECLAHPVSLSRSERDSIIPLYFWFSTFTSYKKKQSNGARLVLEMFKYTVNNIRLQYLHWSQVEILDANLRICRHFFVITLQAYRHCNSATWIYTIPLNDSQLTSQHNYSNSIQSTTACLRETTIVAES